MDPSGRMGNKILRLGEGEGGEERRGGGVVCAIVCLFVCFFVWFVFLRWMDG